MAGSLDDMVPLYSGMRGPFSIAVVPNLYFTSAPLNKNFALASHPLHFVLRSRINDVESCWILSKEDIYFTFDTYKNNQTYRQGHHRMIFE